VLAVIAGLDVPTEGSSTARSNRPQNALFLGDYSAEPMPMTLNDLCQFQRGALVLHHGVGGVVDAVGCA
jgi:hypothetical protein